MDKKTGAKLVGFLFECNGKSIVFDHDEAWDMFYTLAKYLGLDVEEILEDDELLN